jgi:hypothetical protein
MATIIGRDVYGKSVQFIADAQTVEADATTTAETAVANGAVGASPTHAALSVTGLTSLLGGVALGTVGAITAGTTQTLAGATALKTVSVVNAATLNDGVKFGVAATGSGRIFIVISVGSTATMKVWPNAADKIDAGTTGAAVTLTSAHRVAVFIDTAANNWTSALLGAVSS